MKIRSSLALASLLFASGALMANPINMEITVRCPTALNNFGDYVAGSGSETICGQESSIYFKSQGSADYPSKLVNYLNESSDYDATSGKISCNYYNPEANNSRLTVQYTLANAKGGAILSQNAQGVSILLPMGFAK